MDGIENHPGGEMFDMLKSSSANPKEEANASLSNSSCSLRASAKDASSSLSSL